MYICRLDYNCIFRSNSFEPEFLCKGPATHNLLKFHKITTPQQRNFYIYIYKVVLKIPYFEIVSSIYQPKMKPQQL